MKYSQPPPPPPPPMFMPLVYMPMKLMVCVLILKVCVMVFPLQTNTFQGIVITNFTTSFAVFIYKCNDLQYSASATIGFTSFDVLFANHRLSGYNAKNIACMNSGQNRWVNLVYKLTREDLQPTIPIGMNILFVRLFSTLCNLKTLHIVVYTHMYVYTLQIYTMNVH